MKREKRRRDAAREKRDESRVSLLEKSQRKEGEASLGEKDIPPKKLTSGGRGERRLPSIIFGEGEEKLLLFCAESSAIRSGKEG